ncbi:MAG: ATP synthase F0 subunit A [Candidatus Levybacteria bacterium RIFCSPLOWO2_02_FULL_36_8b]|nr:MAG: ATP synthase F0 subunit A [Candidatus Levybacteria bacterium RIFCSPLOWO2_02_FULL_36_8b]
MTSLVAEPVFFIGKFPVTNVLLDTALVDSLLITGMFVLKRKLSLIPGMFQNMIEMTIGVFYDLTESVAQNRTAKIFPFFMSFFLFILLINWSGLIPGVGSIGFFHHVDGKKELIPIVRSATSDLNTTLALALISAFATHILSLKTLGIKSYLGRYFSLNPVNMYVGILEIISEITKIISLSFRLFGNVFAGEVVLLTVSTIFAFLFPIPFLLLEIIVGFVQALVFSMLTMAFMAILTTPHHESEEVINNGI